jgi:hypothetical protein
LVSCYFVPGDGEQIVNHFQKKDDVDAEMTMARTGGGRKEAQKEASNKRREAGRRRRDFLAELADRGCIHLGNHALANTNNLRKSIGFCPRNKLIHTRLKNKLGQPLSGLSFTSLSGQSFYLSNSPSLSPYYLKSYFSYFSKLPPLLVVLSLRGGPVVQILSGLSSWDLEAVAYVR